MKKIVLLAIALTVFVSVELWADYKDQCSSGDIQACYQLGKAYAEGKGVERDEEIAKMYLDIACKYGVAEACEQPSHNGKEDAERVEAVTPVLTPPDIERIKRQCQSGDMEECYKAGLLYQERGESSKGKEKKMALLKLANSFFDLSCEGDVYRGCAETAFYYAASSSKKPDYLKAREYARKACEHNVGSGCYLLSFLFREGKGVLRDSSISTHYKQKAVEFYKSTCRLNNNKYSYGYGNYQDIAFACGELGTFYAEGIDDVLKIDENKAEAYYQKACRLASADACYLLGIKYEKITPSKAIQYYQKSCRYGYESGCKEAEELKSTKRMSKAYILDAILNGSKHLSYPMGSMPSGMATGADAEDIAVYISAGMKGEMPAAFAACAACHGNDGKGMDGFTPNIHLNEGGRNETNR